MATWVFPGQGSQAKGMGAGLFSRFPDLICRADALLGYSVAELCSEDHDGRLARTEYTQPVLYVVNALSFYAKREDTGRGPDFAAGHSLGEYNALLAAGAVDFETGLRLVVKRGELMAGAAGGAMAAVSGLDAEEITRTLHAEGLAEIDIANLNSPAQIVVSGPAADIARAVAAFTGRRVACVPLKVSGAFHSRYMRAAAEEFADFLRGVRFRSPSLPVIANVDARPYAEDRIAAKLVEQMTHPVQWTETIRYLTGKGETVFEEVGPGRVLTRLIGRIRNDAPGPGAGHDPAAAGRSLPPPDRGA